MNIPKLRKEPTVKSCHNIDWEDDYSWVHQENILDVLISLNDLKANIAIGNSVQPRIIFLHLLEIFFLLTII